jgi:hypothetical protein
VEPLVQFLFQELLGGHPNTLANGGRGRAMVVVSPKGFNAAEYASVCNTLAGWEIDVVTASSMPGAAAPNVKTAEPVQIAATLDDFQVRDFDAIIFCGGNLVDFKSRPMIQKIRHVIDACMSQRRVVATVGNGEIILKEAGVLDGEFRDHGGLQCSRPKDRLGQLITAPGVKQVDELIDVLFGTVLSKKLQQPRVTTSPRSDLRSTPDADKPDNR